VFDGHYPILMDYFLLMSSCLFIWYKGLLYRPKSCPSMKN